MFIPFPLRQSTVVVSALLLQAFPALAQELVVKDSVTVTATREARVSADVPESIAVIDGERLEQEKMFNVSDALKGTPGVLIQSNNGAYDARLIIRGAGLKANYGIREIMVLRDGVPVTDPDSFTRLDFIDTQDIEQIEITKGPGNIYATGSAGGTIQILSKSVFDEQQDQIRLGLGEQGTRNLHFRKSGFSESGNALALTYSHRETENNWRHWNEFQSDQLGVKGGLLLSDESELELELSLTKADVQLPGAMTETQFEQFKNTGKQEDNNSAFKHSGRYSEIIFANSRYTRALTDNTDFIQRLYINHWSHYHPVTGAINDTPDVTIFGTDLEIRHQHTLLGDDSLVAGVTVRQDRDDGSKKYAYRDYLSNSSGRMLATLSDEKGDWLETQDTTNTVIGMFFQESLKPTERWLVDAGFRLDHISIKQETLSSDTAYNYGAGRYVTIPGSGGYSELDKSFTLFSPRLGVSYRLNPQFSLFGNIAQGEQVPFSSELESNHDLKSATNRSVEFGVKGRAENWQMDMSIYFTKVDDEIIAILEDGRTIYQNAGSTDKKGLELQGQYQLFNNQIGSLWLGASYAYSDYQYDAFQETVRVAGVPVSLDRSGNQLPYVPNHQFGLSASYQHPSGIKARLQADTWGEYYLDNANTEKYGGYDMVTSLNLGYSQGPHAVSLNVQNLFDQRYAVEVKKDTSGKKSYTPGSPRTAMLSYRYQF